MDLKNLVNKYRQAFSNTVSTVSNTVSPKVNAYKQLFNQSANTLSNINQTKIQPNLKLAKFTAQAGVDNLRSSARDSANRLSVADRTAKSQGLNYSVPLTPAIQSLNAYGKLPKPIQKFSDTPFKIQTDPKFTSKLDLRNPNANKLGRTLIEGVGNMAKATILGDKEYDKGYLDASEKLTRGEKLTPKEIEYYKLGQQNDMLNLSGTFGGLKAKNASKFPKFVNPMDGKIRIEISDLSARLRGNVDDVVNRLVKQGERPVLPDILEHKTLYENYPDLLDTKIVVDRSMTGNGKFDPNKNTLTINTNGKTREKVRSTILHEIQHGLQEIEDFARGTNNDVNNPQFRAWLLKRYEPLVQDLPAYKAIDSPKGRFDFTMDYAKSQTRTNNIQELADRFYWETGGEAEARLVQKREFMTSKQRKEIDPYSQLDINPKDAIVQYPEYNQKVNSMSVDIDAKSLLDSEVTRLKESIGGVGKYETGDGKTLRQSNNPQWYREFYQANGRAPTKTEMYELAEKNLRTGKVDGFYSDTSELASNRQILDSTMDLDSMPVEQVKASPKPASSVREGKTYKIIKQEGIVEVKGTPVKLVDGLDTFVHEGTGGWVVSEASSGRYISEGVTKNQAIANAKKAISDIGEKKVKQIVASKQLNPPSGKVKLKTVSNDLKPTKKFTPVNETPKVQQAPEKVIEEARKQVGTAIEKPDKSIKQVMDTLYTQWVDRYNPITKASSFAKKILKGQGAELRPEYDPEYLVRRLTGASGIADQRYQTELKPIIDEIDKLKIDKTDMDVYLINKRISGFGDVNRDVYGVDPVKAREVVSALEQKYGDSIKQVAPKLYAYQNKGFQEMIDAGFISPESGATIRSQNPDYVPFQRVMDELDNYLGLPTRKLMQGTQPIQKLKGSDKKIISPLEEIIANTFKQRAAIEKNKVAKSIVGLQKIAPDLGFKLSDKSSDSTITIWNKGVKEYWEVGSDIAETAKGLNEESANTLLKLMTTPAAILRQGATGRNPEFMIPNIIRDQLDAGITSKYGYIPFIDYVSGFWSLNREDKYYQIWKNSGAMIDLGEMSGRKAIQKSLQGVQPKKRLSQWLGSALDFLGEYSEQPTRVGLFKKAYKKTGNELLAAMESRDSTVDFARMGSKMKVANSIIPFLNVGVQGFDKLIRATKNNPGKVLFNATLYGTLPAVATTLYNLTYFKDEYGEIPQYEKDSNFVLISGRNADGTVDYKTFPKGNILPVIANPVENAITYLNGANKQSFSEFATQFISSTLPVVGDGQSVKEVATKTIGSNLPQIIKPITENLMNKSFYKYDTKKEQTKEIVPYFLQKEEPYKQAYKFTPESYKTIGAVLNVSPLQVQNLLEGYLAGYVKIPTQIIQMAVKASNNEDISPNDVTILRRFMKQTYPTTKPKEEPKKEATPLAERVLPKGMALTPEEQAQLEEDKKVIRDQVRETGKPAAIGNSVFYKDGNTVHEVVKNLKAPTLTESAEINKKLVADYKRDITGRANYVMYAYENGTMSEKDAETELVKLAKMTKDATASIAKPKKGKKPKKISFKVKVTKVGKFKSKKAKVRKLTPVALNIPKLPDYTKPPKKFVAKADLSKIRGTAVRG